MLSRWREQLGGTDRVFEIATELKTAWSHLLERAQITGFRWHDLRHHFASRPVQRGVPLNTVRDLLGHNSAMTLRYAHLAPDQRREAVAKLIERPLFSALTMRLSWGGQSAEMWYPIDSIGGKGGTRTLDPGIMSAMHKRKAA
jgi:hypothetical protein